ncbi:MAG: class I SAM-dependent methyltransferase, partial [Bacteroidota bacterium]|nr:class I SAM-dependent methyltransferase [Bacteroidota bacterium]
MWYDKLLSNNLVPERLIRKNIKKLLIQRLREEENASGHDLKKHIGFLVDELKENPIAVNTKAANEQHYELPTEFFKYVLGPYMKYSCGSWENNATSLIESECEMLALTCQRADLKEGQDVLELGCGWGSLSLFMAQNFPSSRFTVVSNSSTQKIHIDKQIAERKLKNLEVITADMNTFDIEKRFDRVVSVEMFEHMRNYQKLMKNISKWLKEDGKLFVHIFTHHK